MEYVTTLLRSIKPSATLAVKAKATELKAQGRSIVDLSAGEPDVDTPQHIKDAAIAALKAGKTKYTAVPGIPELRTAIAQKFTEENGIKTDPDDVVITNGGKQALYECFQAVIEPGDEVVIPAPYWVSYPPMVTLCGGNPVIVETTPESGYRLTPETLSAAISPKTKIVVLNSPSNPTGAAYTEADFVALGKVLATSSALVVSDEVYEKLVYDGFQFVSFAKAVPDLLDRTVTVGACSKTYSMTGWRVGYATGPKSIIKAMGKLQSQTTSNVCSIAQHAAIAAINGPHDFLNELITAYRRRFDIAIEMIEKIPGLRVAGIPQGAFYLFVRIDDLVNGSTKLTGSVDVSTFLLEEAGVAVVPGAAFGDDRAIRISVSLADETIIDGLTRIGQALASLT